MARSTDDWSRDSRNRISPITRATEMTSTASQYRIDRHMGVQGYSRVGA